MKKLLFLLVLSCMIMIPFTSFAAPLESEPSWEYISEKYPNGITVEEASSEGIIQPLFVYFDGYQNMTAI